MGVIKIHPKLMVWM